MVPTTQVSKERAPTDSARHRGLRARRAAGRAPAPSLREPQGEHLATGCVERRPVRVGEAREEIDPERRPPSQSPRGGASSALWPGNQGTTDHDHGNPQPGRPTRSGTGTGNGNRRRKPRKPPLLMFDEGCRSRATRKANRKVVAQTKQFVVPALADLDQRQMREVRVLLLEQGPNDGCIDGDFGRRLRSDGHALLCHHLAPP